MSRKLSNMSGAAFDSGEFTTLQVGEIWCSSKSACIQPPNRVRLQLMILGKLEVGENQFVWFLIWAIVW